MKKVKCKYKTINQNSKSKSHSKTKLAAAAIKTLPHINFYYYYNKIEGDSLTFRENISSKKDILFNTACALDTLPKNDVSKQFNQSSKRRNFNEKFNVRKNKTFSTQFNNFKSEASNKYVSKNNFEITDSLTKSFDSQNSNDTLDEERINIDLFVSIDKDGCFNFKSKFTYNSNTLC